jgi:uncharacterized protein YjbI with pentapeptide repeats
MVVTFYSFKGGVGRSLALINVAEILADAGYRTVVCDWDLEAPGLERYVYDDGELTQQLKRERGIIDLLQGYKERLSDATAARSAEEFLQALERPSNLLVPIDSKRRRAGSVALLTAGQRSPEDADRRYTIAVQEFDWTEFYEKWAGGSWLEFFRKDLESGSEIILVDSRTGVTEHSGVCTHHLADIVVLLSASNDLNINGTVWMADKLVQPELAALRRIDGVERGLTVLPVAARIEQTSQKNELTQFRSVFASKLVPYAPEWARPHAIRLEIPYVPFYSFTERVVAREAPEERHREMYESYMRLASAIVRAGTVTGLLAESPASNVLTVGDTGVLASTAADAQLNAVLIAHREWVRSGGKQGTCANLEGVTLTGKTLSNAILSQAILRNANLSGSILAWADLSGADGRGAVFGGSDMEGASLAAANLQLADLRTANLTRANLQGARFIGATLEQANLREADLTGAQLKNAALAGTDLRAAILADVTGLTRSQLADAITNADTRLPEFFEPEPRETFGRKEIYDAFVSYSHVAEGRLSEAIVAGLEHFARPGYSSGRRIYRDRTALSASQSLWTTIERSLVGARYLVYIASPSAAQSLWIRREVELWIEVKGSTNILIVLAEGTIVWDRKTGDFDWEKTTALPPAFRQAFAADPMYVDATWITRSEHLSLGHPRFRELIASLAAVMDGTTKDEAYSADVRRFELSRRLLLGVTASIALAAVVLTILATFQWRQAKTENQHLRKQIEALQLQDRRPSTPRLH